jgi:hypothetical protein
MLLRMDIGAKMKAVNTHAINLSAQRADRHRNNFTPGDGPAEYIANVAMELRNVAKSAEMKTLQGLLEVAYYEAFQLANPSKPTPEELDYLRDLETAARKTEEAPPIRQRRSL